MLGALLCCLYLNIFLMFLYYKLIVELVYTWIFCGGNPGAKQRRCDIILHAQVNVGQGLLQGAFRGKRGVAKALKGGSQNGG